MLYKNLDECDSYTSLSAVERVSLKRSLTVERVLAYKTPVGGGLTYSYAAKPVSEKILKAMQALAEEQEVVAKYEAILTGQIMNVGENRLVAHHQTRGALKGIVEHNGKNLTGFYQTERDRFSVFAEKIRSGAITGSTGKKITHVVQIGIGGSDLGPRALYLALKNACPSSIEASFISNVDPDDANAALSEIDLESTLFILVSKSGTTQETLANRNFVLETIKTRAITGYDGSKHMVAVTGESGPLAKNSDFLDSFYIDDFIGGRYSSTSAVGGLVLSIAFGSNVFEELLAGAGEADALALDSNILRNAALLDALIGLYERNVLNYTATAVLPYSQALVRFPAHLQQLDMESNGKVVNRFNKKLHYKTGPVIFGEPGTNGQHSFYQLLHQGSDVIPLQFIGFNKAQTDRDYVFEGSTSHEKLLANLAAQIGAFALGQPNAENLNKDFEGERPCSLIYGERLSPKALGALLAHFENKVMFQGFLWNLNSFDQEGVQLGKKLAGQLLMGEADERIATIFNMLR